MHAEREDENHEFEDGDQEGVGLQKNSPQAETSG
jgi:hypothetical protein